MIVIGSDHGGYELGYAKPQDLLKKEMSEIKV